ncbi:MAG: N4-gp56 family major capsid protein [Bacteroidaceae bacterium]|nr:N4-gp56 family major capsid protein [Paraprevotella sp.]MDY2716258.1 N4-gp56 family major capsid protein [Bacteroidaceae bacterium]
MKFKFNLQLFANHVNVTTDATSGNNLSAEMKTFYDMTLIDEASAQLVHDQFGQKRPIPKNGGKTIEFRKFASLPKAMTPLTEGVTPDGKKLDVTSITATVAQYGDYITQSDVLELTALDNTILEATKLLGRQSGMTLDTITRNVINAGTNVSYCPKVATDGTETAVTSRAGLDTTCVLTVKAVQKAVAKLKGQNAPKINGSYVAIIHPYAAYQLMRDPEWMYPHQYQDTTNLYEGEIGKIAGVRFVETTEAKVWRNEANTHAVFSTLFIGDGAYGVTEITGGGLQTIVKQKGSAGTADPLDQRSSVGWKAIKTAEMLVENYLVRVESCVPDFDGTAAN